MRNAGKAAILLILLASFFVRLAFAYAEPVKWWDETVYASLGWDLKSNPTHYSFDGGWSDYVPGGWPKAGYRAPLLPYSLALFFAAFGQNMVLLNMIMPAIGALNVLLVYLLGKKMFSRKIGLYAAAFLAFMPVHVYYSGKILTDVFSTTLITLSVLAFLFWNEKKTAKTGILFGAATALAFLSRYQSIVLLPIFLIFLLAKKDAKNFLNKSLFIAVAAFLLVLMPWLFYSYSEYGDVLGFMRHSQAAAGYWGGNQQWYEILPYFPAMFSITLILAAFGIAGMNKSRRNENNLLLLLWLFAFLFFSLFLLPHKEDRFFMEIAPAVAIISAVGVEAVSKRIKRKNAEKVVLCVSVLVLLATIMSGAYYTSLKLDKTKDECFLNATSFLKNAESNSLVFTDKSPIIYFYTHKQTHFQAESYERMETLTRENYLNKVVYYLWEYPNKNIANETDNNLVFACPSENSLIGAYKIS